MRCAGIRAIGDTSRKCSGTTFARWFLKLRCRLALLWRVVVRKFGCRKNMRTSGPLILIRMGCLPMALYKNLDVPCVRPKEIQVRFRSGRQSLASTIPPISVSVRMRLKALTAQLRRVMFKRDAKALRKAQTVVQRHIEFDECKKIGLKVNAIESDQMFQDLLLTVHHCYMHALMRYSRL